MSSLHIRLISLKASPPIPCSLPALPITSACNSGQPDNTAQPLHTSPTPRRILKAGARHQRCSPWGASGLEVRGIARKDERTKNLVMRLSPGDIAVIDHEDIDEVAAQGLLSRKVRAVINAATS